MPDETPPASTPTPTAGMMATPEGMLALASMLLLAGWVIFSVGIDETSFPTQSLVAAGLVLMARNRTDGALGALGSRNGLFVLGAVIALTALVWFVGDVRSFRIYTPLWLVGSIVHYAAGLLAGLAARQLMR